MSAEFPNLDGMSTEQMQHFVRGLKQIEMYCLLRQSANDTYQKGEKAFAFAQERNLKELYNTLPAWARW